MRAPEAEINDAEFEDYERQIHAYQIKLEALAAVGDDLFKGSDVGNLLRAITLGISAGPEWIEQLASICLPWAAAFLEDQLKKESV